MIELLRADRFRAAIDVYPTEPLDRESPLRDLDAVITTPHIAGALPEALRQIGRRLVADLRSIAEHETPRALQYLTHHNLAGLRQA